MTHVYEELAEPSRRQILGELRTGPKKVGELVDATGLKQPNVSNHLARMRSRGVLEAQKVGREVYYNLASPDIAEAVRFVLEEATREYTKLEPGDLIHQYAKDAIHGDESACGNIIDELLRRQTSLLSIYTEFLTPAMALVGQWYKDGRIDEAQEHLASGITERMMARANNVRCPQKKCAKTAVLGCPPGNWHALGLRMVSDYLRQNGWNTLFLGPNVPAHSFVSTVLQHQPDLVLISCSTDESVEAVIPLVELLAKEKSETLQFKIGLGGSAVAKWRNPLLKAGADFVATSLTDFAHNVLPTVA
jgi:methanogenic corrinoid protein MtbC1